MTRIVYSNRFGAMTVDQLDEHARHAIRYGWTEVLAELRCAVPVGEDEHDSGDEDRSEQ